MQTDTEVAQALEHARERVRTGAGVGETAQLNVHYELSSTGLSAELTREGSVVAEQVAQYLLPHHGGYAVEKFGIVSLNTKHRVLRTTILSSAILDASLVHPAIAFRTPAVHHATAIVLFHNHPSGGIVRLRRRVAE